jgi:hypothetical protein
MTFLVHWIPTLVIGTVLAVAGLILRAINHRKDGSFPSPRPTGLEPREGHTRT